jgi:hypothetical protein
MRPNSGSLNGWEGLEDDREVPKSQPAHWRGWLVSGEQGSGGSVKADVELAKDIIASHPRKPMGLVGFLTSPLATTALMTVLERSPRNGDARWGDGASACSRATPTDGEDG